MNLINMVGDSPNIKYDSIHLKTNIKFLQGPKRKVNLFDSDGGQNNS